MRSSTVLLSVFVLASCGGRQGQADVGDRAAGSGVKERAQDAMEADGSAPDELPAPDGVALEADTGEGDTGWEFELVLDGPQEDGDDLAGDSGEGPGLGEECGAEGLCGEGVCDQASGLCVQCLEDLHCPVEKFCAGGECQFDVCIEGVASCANDTTVVTCSENGSEASFEICPEGQLCAAGKCKDELCKPGTKWCTGDYYLEVCDATGTQTAKTICPPGYACVSEGCSQIRHNIMVVFDTSGSMYDGTQCGSWNPKKCEHPWPDCEMATDVFSPLGSCKLAFGSVFADQLNGQGKVNFMLFRFAQKLGSGYPDCTSGYYSELGEMTGDNDAHVTPDGPDSWFDKNMFQVVCVGFPETSGEGNVAECMKWVDFEEAIEPDTDMPCSSQSGCPGGMCMSSGGTKVCHFHSNPELRAEGWTPLGKTMFYVGEYVRKRVVVDGLACTQDSDCGNFNYRCSQEGKCRDPISHCRENVMLLFTDGEETENTSTSDFFNPGVQAKRFRYGLGCKTDEDCIHDALCQGSGTCAPSTPGYFLNYNDPKDADVLKDYNGTGIKMSVHVVYTGTNAGANKEIAVNGGGGYYPVNSGNLGELIEAVKTIVDVKANIEQCVPSPVP